MTTESWEGRPVFEYEDERIDVDVTRRYYYHIRPDGSRTLLGKFVRVRDIVGMAYKDVGSGGMAEWDLMAVMSPMAAYTTFKDMNIRIMQEEHQDES